LRKGLAYIKKPDDPEELYQKRLQDEFVAQGSNTIVFQTNWFIFAFLLCWSGLNRMAEVFFRASAKLNSWVFMHPNTKYDWCFSQYRGCWPRIRIRCKIPDGTKVVIKWIWVCGCLFWWVFIFYSSNKTYVTPITTGGFLCKIWVRINGETTGHESIRRPYRMCYFTKPKPTGVDDDDGKEEIVVESPSKKTKISTNNSDKEKIGSNATDPIIVD